MTFRRSYVWPLLTVLLAALLALPAAARDVSSAEIWNDPQLWCDRDGGWHDGHGERFCEVRSLTLPATGRIAVDGAQNGGVRVEGWDGNEVLVLAKVQVWDRDVEDAEALARRIEIETHPTIIASGARRDVSVSYRVRVPRHSDLELDTHNGGISIVGVEGDIQFAAANGGVSLVGVAGDVRGRTRNGGLKVELDGDGWRGAGLDVETTNGGVKLYLPEGYSAELETGTTNGGLRSDVPGVEVEGRRLHRRHIRTTLGSGGAPLRVMTTNGGVVIAQR